MRKFHTRTPFQVVIDGLTWTDLRIGPDGYWWAECGTDSQRWPVERFAELLPSFQQWERAMGEAPTQTDSQPLGSPLAAPWQPLGSPLASALQRPCSPLRTRRVNVNSLQALDKARELAKPQPYDVVSRWWPIVVWIDHRAGLQQVAQLGAFPKPLAREANERFTALLQKYPRRRSAAKTKSPDWYRSERFYMGLVHSYFEYKALVQVPIWWLRFELWFEDNFYKHIID